MEAPAPLISPPGCSQCGSSVNSAYWSGGVCLRCAGARLLGGDSGGSGDTLSSPATDREALPERIGPYEILEELGRGGMGRVYAARQIGLGRIVALKVMGDASRSADFELRFLREAQTAARLRHPNLVAVHDFGRTDGHLYFSMDYIEGGDLARRLRGRPFAPWEAASLLRKVTLALAHAHQDGVLHRDLKPSNILLDGDEPKLADFGLAAQLEAGGDLTAAGGILGTPHYLSPEALRGGSAALSVASDLYAMGVMLFELLTGRTPFAGAAPGALITLVENSEPPSPRLLAPAVPRDLETICLKCLERDPSRRYGSALALAEDLRRFLDGEPILARPLSAPDRFLRWCRRRPALAGVWVLVSALALGSTVAAVTIQRTLGRAVKAEADGRERLRDARLAEARAVRRTTQPGHRQQALAALAEAATIRPGTEVRAEAIAALLVTDVHPREHWIASPGVASTMAFDRAGRIAGVEPLNVTGRERGPARLRPWGTATSGVQLARPATNALGPLRISRDGSLAMERFLDQTVRLWRTSEAAPFFILRDRPAPGGLTHTASFNDDYDFSPDGQAFALGLPDHGLSLHRIPDGTELARTGEGDHFTRLRYSPDGTHVAAICTSDAQVRDAYIFATPSLKTAHRIPLVAEPTSIAWSDDGRLLALSLGDNTIMVYDVAQGHLATSLHSPAREPNELAFLGRDSLLALRGRGTTLHLLNAINGQEEVAIENFGTSPVTGAPDGLSFVTASTDGVITRWQVDQPIGLRILPPSTPGGRERAFNNSCLDFSPDGRLAVSSHGRYLMLREVATGRLLVEFDDGDTHGDENTSVAFTDGGRSVLRCSDYSGLSRLVIQPGPDGGIRVGAPELLDPEPGLGITDHLPDGRRLVLTAAEGNWVKVVEVSHDRFRVVRRWPVPGAYSAALSPQGDRVLVNGTGTGPDAARQRVQVFQLADGKVVAELPGQAFGETAWSGDGRTAMTSNGQKESILWDTTPWKPRVTLRGALAGNISSFQLSPDGTEAVVVRDRLVHLLSTVAGTELMLIDLPDAPGLASSIRYLPDGHRFGVLWHDGRLDIIDPEAIRAELAARGLDR